MDWKVFGAAFLGVFFAELADKTQLVSIGMSSKTGRPVLVWVASVCAYALVTVLSVFIGAVLGKYLKPEVVRYAGAALFIVIGLLILSGRI